MSPNVDGLTMHTQPAELHALAHHLVRQGPDMLDTWRGKVRGDPGSNSGEALPRLELDDHIPALLAGYADRLRLEAARGESMQIGAGVAPDAADGEAAAHGSHRWRQGYDLHEVTRELGRLNEVVVAELDAYADTRPFSHGAAAVARKLWAESHTHYSEQSTTRYFQLQRAEAAGHVRDLEQAVQAIHELDRQRAELWQQIAHDLRGNIGVVASAASGLRHANVPDDARTRLLHMLERNVDTLKHFLDDVTELARLHAGQEQLRVSRYDAATVLTDLCEGLQAYAQERRLYLRTRGPASLNVEGDAGKVRRIAQNLIINALKYTNTGGVVVVWSRGGAADPARWVICIEDTGPGIHHGPVAQALEPHPTMEVAAAVPDQPLVMAQVRPQPNDAPHGEGIGLSIVKRLAELLNASLEIETESGKGSRFRVVLPQAYPDTR